MSTPDTRPTLLCIAGPTASGKSALALNIAQQGWAGRSVELITVDSAQVYRDMDVGTAKPTADELALAPHHLLNLIDPTQSYSAGQFTHDALACIEQVLQRGAQPVLVGGTMLYYKALLEGLDDLPQANLAVRAQIEQEAAQRGWPALHAQLVQVDPAFAAGVTPQDAQRISRGLEVWRGTGRALSSYFGNRTQQPPYNFVLLSMEPQGRAWLHARIAQRFDQMLAQGLEQELRLLRQRYSLQPNLPSMRCVGYRQMWQYLDGEVDAAQMREAGIAATRQLAKRQLTWLRSLAQRHAVACDAPDAVAQAMQFVQTLQAGLDTAAH